jgi:hypothetical protein
MKVTAIISDKLIDKVKKLTGGSTITESIIIALEDFIRRRRLIRTIQKIKRQPLSFRKNYSSDQTRKLNRKA